VELAGSSRDLEESSGSLVQIFLLSLLIVYLILAAQFESFRDPLVILLTVPLALAGAMGSLAVFGCSLNLFSEIGLVMLVGLVTKNGILIVEFAGQRREAGLPPKEAVIDAASARLRPILMTTLCTILGTLPIALALGAGSESRKPMGIAVIGGLSVSLCLTLFVVPAVYVMISRNRSEVAS
jgi:multidrug efflux pump